MSVNAKVFEAREHCKAAERALGIRSDGDDSDDDEPIGPQRTFVQLQRSLDYHVIDREDGGEPSGPPPVLLPLTLVQLQRAIRSVRRQSRRDSVKTGMFRWKADYDSAADEYSQAAKCYRIARDVPNSKECYLKASDCYKKTNGFFHAAKCLEGAIIACKETAQPDEIYNLAVEAGSLYQQYGSGDAGASVLDKAAKILEERSPELAVKLFQQAADVSSVMAAHKANENIVSSSNIVAASDDEDDGIQEDQTESSQHQGAEYISKASRILVKLQRYDQAVDSLRREIGFHQESGNMGAIGRLTVAIVLVQLARGDAVAAEKAYKEWGSNCEVQEMQTLEQILQAYDEEDRESAKRALANPFIRNMDVEYARLAASVPLPEALEPAPRATVRENAAPSYVSPNAATSTTAEVSNVEVDESPYAPVTYTKKSDDEDGLC